MDMVQLRNGAEVEIRPIRADDGHRLEAAYERLSPQSQYSRFLAPKPYLSPSEIRYLVDVDQDSHVALVATPAGHPESIVAVARFVRLADDPAAAEFAVVVGDPWQRQGLASEMLSRLALEARRHGIERLRATMLAGNQPAHRLMRRLGPPRRVGGDGPVHELEASLPVTVPVVPVAASQLAA